MITPLDGSKIRIDNESGYQKLVIPQPSRGLKTYFSSIFWISLIVIWVFVWIEMLLNILSKSSNEPPGPSFILGFGFVTFWLVLAISGTYKTIRPAVPETLVLSRPFLLYDSGVEPVRSSSYYRSREEFHKKLSQKRIRAEFDMIHLKTLQLTECEGGSKLTIDKNCERIEIGAGATESEREWLFEILQKEYDL